MSDETVTIAFPSRPRKEEPTPPATVKPERTPDYGDPFVGKGPSNWLAYARWLMNVRGGGGQQPEMPVEAGYSGPPMGEEYLEDPARMEEELRRFGIDPATGQPVGFDPTGGGRYAAFGSTMLKPKELVTLGSGSRALDESTLKVKEDQRSRREDEARERARRQAEERDRRRREEEEEQERETARQRRRKEEDEQRTLDKGFTYYVRPVGGKGDGSAAEADDGNEDNHRKLDKAFDYFVPPTPPPQERELAPGESTPAAEGPYFAHLHDRFKDCPPPQDEDLRSRGVSPKALEETKLHFLELVNGASGRISGVLEEAVRPAVSHAMVVAELAELAASPGGGRGKRERELEWAANYTSLQMNEERLELGARLDEELEQVESLRQPIRDVGARGGQSAHQIHWIICKFRMLLTFSDRLRERAEVALRAITSAERARFASVDPAEALSAPFRLLETILPLGDKGWFTRPSDVLYREADELVAIMPSILGSVLEYRPWDDFRGTRDTAEIARAIRIASEDAAVEFLAGRVQPAEAAAFARVRNYSGWAGVYGIIEKVDLAVSLGPVAAKFGTWLAKGAAKGGIAAARAAQQIAKASMISMRAGMRTSLRSAGDAAVGVARAAGQGLRDLVSRIRTALRTPSEGALVRPAAKLDWSEFRTLNAGRYSRQAMSRAYADYKAGVPGDYATTPPSLWERARRVVYDDRPWDVVRRERNRLLLTAKGRDMTWEHMFIKQRHVAAHPWLRGVANSYVNTFLRIPRSLNARSGQSLARDLLFKAEVAGKAAWASYAGYRLGREIGTTITGEGDE